MKCPHCDIPIDEHEASRCLDAWVAEAVMGLKKRVFEGQNPKSLWDDEFIFNEMESTGLTHRSPEGGLVSLKDYSTSIAAAWEVVERLLDGPIEIAKTPISYWIAKAWWRERQQVKGEGKANTAPLAICRAALKAAV